MIKYKKMSLFDAPSGSFLVHAANSEGIWGSGIAVEIKKRYPSQEKHYKKYSNLLGDFVYDKYHNDIHTIVNLITSSLDSRNPDRESIILLNTTLSLNEFLKYLRDEFIEMPIYSNKFNSGLFNVPWEKTEFILKELCNRYGIEWVVCDPNLEEN